jgi:hypothetical protein
MASIRPLFLFAAVPLVLAACGDDGGTIIPEGEHYQYVSKRAYIPTNNNLAREYGLDLDGNNAIDNQLGKVLGTLSTSAGMGFNLQRSIDEAVAEGSITLLLDFQTKDFQNTTAAGLKVLLGDNEMPAPCNTNETHCNEADPPVCTGCAHHLQGTGSFAIADGSPDNAAVAGKIINGTFNGGPGNISLQIALGGTGGIQLDLIGARAKASGITDTAIESVILAGALTQSDLNEKVIPAIATQLGPTIAEYCTMLSNPPTCGCEAASTGETILELFDTITPDCSVTPDEISMNPLIQTVLEPDVTINGTRALSLGIKVEAVHGTFPAQN